MKKIDTIIIPLDDLYGMLESHFKKNEVEFYETAVNNAVVKAFNVMITNPGGVMRFLRNELKLNERNVERINLLLQRTAMKITNELGLRISECSIRHQHPVKFITVYAPKGPIDFNHWLMLNADDEFLEKYTKYKERYHTFIK